MNGLMRVSRKGFLRSCATLVAARGMDPLSVFAFADRAAAPAVKDPGAGATMFHAHVGTRAVAVDDAGTRVPLTLAAVSDVRACGPFEQFAVTFHAAPGTALADGIYQVQHAALGDMQLFIAAVGRPEKARSVYQACFSRRAAQSRGATDRE
jgi:hypothetical protein